MATFRGALRLAAQTALIAADTLAGESVVIEADWAAQQASPLISISTPNWRHDDRSMGAGVPQFWSVITLFTECRAAEPDAGGTGRATLVNALDTLSDQVESALAQFIIGPPQLFRRIVSIDGEQRIDASDAQHQGELNLRFAFEYATDGEAAITMLLQQVRLVMIRRMKFGGQFGGAFLQSLAGADINIDQL